MSELMVVVSIAGRRCAFHAHEVHSVIELGQITPIPCAPGFIAGMTALRSQALTVIDCRRVVSAEPGEDATDVRAPVVTVGGYSYALLVDEVEGIAESLSEIDSVLGGFGERWQGIAHGMVEMAEGPALVLDVAALTSPTGQAAQAA